MQETQAQSLSLEDPLEKEMATYSSILPGEVHGQSSLAGYSSWDHRVRYDWVTNFHFFSENTMFCVFFAEFIF